MKISIITPSLNQGKFIEETINSVISQAGDFELEYIIIDGGSTDKTLDIIKNYAQKDPRIKWISEKDDGQSDAINKGFKMATGEILNWLCSDDLLGAGALHKICDFFQKNRQAYVVFGSNQFIDENGEKIKCLKSREFTRPELIKRWSCVYQTFNLPQPSTFVRKEVLKDIGFLDVDNHLCMDYDWYLKINKKYKFFFIDEQLSKSRFHQNCKSIKSINLQYRKSLEVSRKYWNENFSYYFASYLASLPYAWACLISSKLRKRFGWFNNFMDFVKGD